MPILYLVSLGCSKNQVDSEAMLGQLLPRGFRLCAQPEEADILIVNTCGFIEAAREESLSVVRELSQNKHKGQKLIVCGCLTHVADDRMRSSILDVDQWLSIRDEQNIFEILTAWFDSDSTAAPLPRIRISPPHYAYMRVADGCDHRCSFCAIPGIRGQYVSRPVDSILDETVRLAEEGVVELNIIAQDTSGYGKDLFPQKTLSELLRRICRIDGIQWIRLQYLYPATLTDELLAVMAAEEKICSYIDLPLQHISNPILRHMKRPGEKSTRRLLETIRRYLPDCALRTAMITGYPLETETAFRELYDFIAEEYFDHLGVFEYSHEAGTAAFELTDCIPVEEKRRRRDELMRLQQGISLRKNLKQVGETVLVLIDQTAGKKAVGRRRADAPEVDDSVHVRNAGSLPPGSIVPVRITRAEPYDLYGTVETGLFE